MRAISVKETLVPRGHNWVKISVYFSSLMDTFGEYVSVSLEGVVSFYDPFLQVKACSV